MKKNTVKKSKWAAFTRRNGTFDIDALTEAQKEQFFRESEALTADNARLLPSAQRRLHAQARHRGRPRNGRRVEIISLSIEKDLLPRAERLAEAQGLSRSDLFSRGLRAVLAIAGAA
jgi:hypothetical protein